VEINVEKNKLMRISRQPSPMQFMTDKKNEENVEYFTYLGCIIINYTRCTREIRCSTNMANVAFIEKKTFSPTNWTWN